MTTSNGGKFSRRCQTLPLHAIAWFAEPQAEERREYEHTYQSIAFKSQTWIGASSCEVLSREGVAESESVCVDVVGVNLSTSPRNNRAALSCSALTNRSAWTRGASCHKQCPLRSSKLPHNLRANSCNWRQSVRDMTSKNCVVTYRHHIA